MAVKTYSKASDGQEQLTANFKVGEFACKDGSDKIMVCENLVAMLQKIRDHFGGPISISSAYRTPTYNAKIGGAKKTQHVLGTAADISVSGVAPLAVAQYAETLNPGGLGLYATFVHIDTRAGKARWDQRSGKPKAVTGFAGLQ